MSTRDGKTLSTRNHATTALAVLLATALAACGGEESTPEAPAVSHTAAVSECGGFAKSGPTLGASSDYCAAEKLRWSYDASAATLRILDERVLLNCCGERSVTVKEQQGVYVITERDAPEAGGARCRCICTYDFSVELKQITTGTIKIKLMREIAEEGGAKEIFAGALDLAAGSGAEVVDETDAGGFCDEPETPQPPPSLTQIPRVSECGGFASGKSDEGGDWSGGYCDAETLEWSYDASSGRLKLSNNRAVLNCCGDRSISLSEVNGVYVITERDAPDANGGRCFCTCVFDFGLEVRPVPLGKIQVKLVREITDSGSGPQELYSGQLDLSAGAGSVVVDATDAAGFCDQP